MIIRPWNQNIWFSPKYVINELAHGVIDKIPKKIKRLKEAWICAVAIICWAKNENTEWWIQVPEHDPPDVLAMKLISTEDLKGQDISELKVEVFEISEHDKETVGESIERKLKEKDYLGMTVVGFVRRLGLFNHVLIAQRLQNLKPKAGSVSLIVFEGSNRTNVSYIQLFPEMKKFKVDFGLYCKTSTQRDYIELKRGTSLERADSATTDWLTLIP
jgi:hypothetical protein